MTEFKPTIDSLQSYRCPEWFRDAKFGIYLHWGVYSVVERGEWYARRMYMQGTPEYEHHVQTYGHPSQYGYKEFVPQWRAERFDPDRLVGLFKAAGARYFCPCAVHHDNFDLWNSRHHRWNSVEMGPQQDITGLWREAALRHGLRFGVTTHLARSYSWFNVSKGSDQEGPLAGVPYDGADPQYRDFYHEPHGDTDRRHPLNPPASWRRTWAARIIDLIDAYQPEHLYFDGALPFQGDDGYRTGMEVVAHYYNQSVRKYGSQQCVMCLKNIPDHGLYVPGIATLDLERKRAETALPEPWQTDTSIGPWGYNALRPYRPTVEIVYELVDIVSKNGNMLLNVPPKADGTLDEETEQILADIGRWLDVNGEAIYGTRPWAVAEEDKLRYTHKGEALYAIALGWPGTSLTLRAVGDARVHGVSLLGSNEPLLWSRDAEGLTIQAPGQKPCAYAYAFKIALG
jgi:alpha-L-fucosidase